MSIPKLADKRGWALRDMRLGIGISVVSLATQANIADREGRYLSRAAIISYEFLRAPVKNLTLRKLSAAYRRIALLATKAADAIDLWLNDTSNGGAS